MFAPLRLVTILLPCPLVDTLQENDWHDTRIIFLILTEVGCLSDDIGEDTITFSWLRNAGMDFEVLGPDFDRDIIRMGEHIIVPIGIGGCPTFRCDDGVVVAIFEV